MSELSDADFLRYIVKSGFLWEEGAGHIVNMHESRALAIADRLETLEQVREYCTVLERDLAELDAGAKHDIELLMDSVNTLERENATLRAGYPEGATPTDVRVMREANVALATEVARFRDALEKIAGVELPCIADVDVWLQMRGRARKALEKP